MMPVLRAALCGALAAGTADAWQVPAPDSQPARAPRSWGPEQATGEPDSEAGDVPTAWASKTQDEGDEWLLLRYARPVIPAAVRVYETCAPGALVRVCLITADGKEVEVWKGTDPTTADQKSGVSKVTFQTNLKADRIKLYLDSKAVAGWNEIDAVALEDPAGRAQWAVEAWASSTYAELQEQALVPVGAPPVPPARVARPLPPAPRALPAPAGPAVAADSRPAADARALAERVQRLEAEVNQLKKVIAELKEAQRAQGR